MAQYINEITQNRHIRVRRLEDILEGLTEPAPTRFSWKSFDQSGTAVAIFNWVMVAIIVMILLCILHQRRQSDDTGARPQTEIDQEQEEKNRKKKIFKLYYSEHIQQTITRKQIRNDSCKTFDAALSDSSEDISSGGEYIYDEEEDHGTVVILPYTQSYARKSAGKTSSTKISEDEAEEMNSNPSNHTENEKSVTNLCTICLEEYEEGDTIVWASNKNCPHAFHRACLTNYLVKVKDETSYPCPICRQNFFFGNDKCKKTCGVCEEV